MATRGELAFVLTNHLFTPERERLGYVVIARRAGPGIRGQIVVRADSPIDRIEALAGRTVAFANRYAFAGHDLPRDALLRAGVSVEAVFAGHQEAAATLLRLGKVDAAAVNDRVMAEYARREDFAYRVLWQSEPYHDLALMAHPAVPPQVREAVARALVALGNDPGGRSILQGIERKLGRPVDFMFVDAADRDYDNYRRFYRSSPLFRER